MLIHTKGEYNMGRTLTDSVKPGLEVCSNPYPRLHFCLNTTPWMVYIFPFKAFWAQKHICLPGWRFSVGAGTGRAEVEALVVVGAVVTIVVGRAVVVVIGGGVVVVVVGGVVMVIVVDGVVLVVVVGGGVVVVVVGGVVVAVVIGGVIVVITVVVGGARNQHESKDSSSSRKQESCAGPVHQHNHWDCPQAEVSTYLS